MKNRELLEAAERLGELGTWDWQLQRDHLVWSPGLHRIYGVDPDQLSPSIELVVERTHPDDRPVIERAVEDLRTRGDFAAIDYRILREDGTLRHLHATATISEVRDDAPWRVIGWVRDQTDQVLAAREISARSAVSEALAVWGSFEEGAERLLDGIGQAVAASFGALWIVQDQVLVHRVPWSSDDTVAAFAELSAALRLAPGDDLPGTAWERGGPVSAFGDGVRLAPSRQRRAEEAGFRGGVAVPVIFGGQTIAVLEFLSREPIELTERLAKQLVSVGFEIGIFLSHRRGEMSPSRLTPREQEILQLAAAGKSGREIAALLGISPATVKTHFEHIYERLGVSDRPAAVAEALRGGLID